MGFCVFDCRPLSPAVCPPSGPGLLAYIERRRLEADSRNAAELSGREGAGGAGLVHIKTSRPRSSGRLRLVGETGCLTGIPRSDEWLSPGRLPRGAYPVNPDAVEIDQQLMRLRRLKKNVITSARLHSKETAGRGFHALMVTLTYRPGVHWSPDQISRYIATVKKWYARRRAACRYVWVLELTKAGIPHYHVLFWHPSGRHLSMPKADKRGWWPHGLTRTEKARNAVGYLAKYASKGTDDIMPKGARLYGVGGLTLNSRLVRAWWNLPVGIRRWGFPADRWRRAVGGGWVCRASGEWRAALWSVQFLAGRVFAVPRPQPTPSPFDTLLQALAFPWQRMPF